MRAANRNVLKVEIFLTYLTMEFNEYLLLNVLTLELTCGMELRSKQSNLVTERYFSNRRASDGQMSHLTISFLSWLSNETHIL
jgi:hypothetical protein